MMEAILLSQKGMDNNEGGPFGCIVVKQNKIIGRGNNKVICNIDPTAHAEIVAIREACNYLGTYRLSGCEIYASCEPCPMCLGAIYWARPDIVYFSNTREDAAFIGFDDSMIYSEMTVDHAERKIPIVNLNLPEALNVFKKWADKNDKSLY